jgi:hypothetical protein
VWGGTLKLTATDIEGNDRLEHLVRRAKAKAPRAKQKRA